MDTAGRIRELVALFVDDAEATLYDVEMTGGVLRITVERPGGVDIDVIGRLTRQISRMLDEEDPIAGQYTLEVSSPGLERNLRRPEHFAGAVGTLVALKTRAGVDGDRRVKGVLLAADDDTITVAPTDADPGSARVLALADIERARTVFEWGPTPKPGGRPAAPNSKQPTSRKKAAKP